MPTGTTGALDLVAILKPPSLNSPIFPVFERVPSGKRKTEIPDLIISAAESTALSPFLGSFLSRKIQLTKRIIQLKKGTFSSSFFAIYPVGLIIKGYVTTISKKLMWLATKRHA